MRASKRLLGDGDDIGWPTLPKALQEIEEMLKVASEAELKMLQEHGAYLRERLEAAKKSGASK